MMGESAEEDFRLPQTVVPERYDLTLQPDLTRATFCGEETIRLRLTASTDELRLNALDR